MIDSDKPPEDIRPGETCGNCQTDISEGDGVSIVTTEDDQIVSVDRHCHECGNTWTVWRRW